MTHKHPLPPPSIAGTLESFLPILGIALVGYALIWLFITALTGRKGGAGGSGKVVGVVGRMGSGKSYFAVRMASKRLMAGSSVASNFSLSFDRWCPKHKADYRTSEKCKKCSQAVSMAGRWRRFTGWEQIAELEDCVIILDEAHLYAPSNKAQTFPDIARWKLSMSRKYGLDLYWITQHEMRVNSVLRSLTNFIFVCNNFGDGALFMAKGYEPEKVRRKKQHLQRTFYRLNVRIATLYNTLEILEADGVHVGADSRINELAAKRNNKNAQAKKAVPLALVRTRPAGRRKCEHEKASGDRMNTCDICVPA